MEAERGLGNIDRLGGDFDEAMLHLNRSLEIAESLGDKNGMSKAIGSMGNVHLDQCRYAEALESYERSREMAEATDDKVQMSVCIANMGQVHIDQGRYDEALACFERALEYAESLGNKSGMSAAIGSMGIVHWNQGRYTEAARCFEQQQEICEVVGDKRGVSSAIGFMGLVHMDQGRYAEALQCYERSRKMAEAMDDKVQMSIFIGNMGYVHLAEDRYEDALAVFRKALAGHLAVGFLIYATYWLSGIAAAQLELAEGEPIDHREARENAEECVRISQEIGKPDTLFLGRVLLARIDAAEGNAQLATEKLEAMLAESGAGAALHADEEQIADLHYWLWKISESGVARNGISHPANTQDREVPLRATQAEEALWRYEALCTRIPKFDFRKRIAELKGEHVPKSADDVE
jgi:tetratricopeptide (TPR) repeat protein